MSRIDSGNEDWNYPCSDEEISKTGSTNGEVFLLDPAELESLYNTIEKNGTINLEWRCPGRRAPSPVAMSKEELREMPSNDSVRIEKDDFDFMEDVSSLRLRVRRDGEDTLRGSAKKKTSSFDGIVSNIMRHKRMEQMEREADISSPTSTP